MRSMKKRTGGASLSTGVYLVAEIGFNHGGDLALAKKMISAAADAGASAVKFQSFLASDICLEESPHFKLIQSGELSREDHAELKKCADSCCVDFISTPFDPQWAAFLDSLGVPAFKVASMDLNWKPLLEAVAATGKPVFLSTGMAELPEIREAVRFLEEKGSGQVTVLHCVSKYPTAPEEAQLWRIPALARDIGRPVGFSDHTLGVWAPIAAAALGARVIEKHFTMDKDMVGPDHKISADPSELRFLAEALACVSKAVAAQATPEGRPDSEMRAPVRRGVFAGRDIQAGQEISAADLRFVRPATVPLEELPRILGRKARGKIAAATPLRPELLA